MTIHNLDKIFHPSSIAVVGASTKPASVGRTVLENLQRAGFPGDLYPVNPNYSSILDLPAFSGIDQLPTVPDLAIIATPAVSVPAIVRQCGEFGVEGLIVLSAGFREVGSAGQALESELADEVARFPGMRVIGPNCLGVLVPEARLNASFAAAMPQSGHVAFISQSGALCTSILDWSLAENVGFSNFVSIGNALNVRICDLIDYFDEDPQTTSIVLYVESLSDSRQFMSAARAFAGSKPIVVYKAGRFAQSAQAAASHTGAMAGVDAVYEAAFQRAGMVRVYRAEDMFDCAELLAHHRTPHGSRLAIISNAGGPGVMATDELLECNGELAELSTETLEKLESMLPPHWSHGNPVDVLGDAGPERFAQALEAVLGDRGVDAVLVILTPQAMTDPTGTAQIVATAAARTPKPILAAWMGGPAVAVGRNILAQAGVAAYESPDRAVRAFMYLISYRRNREILYETPRPVPMETPLDRSFVQAQLDKLASNRQQALTELDSKAILAAYGVPTAVPKLARTSLEAVEIAHNVGYPVVMKVHSPQIVHKTEVQGVITGISNDAEVRRVFQDIAARARQKRPDAEIEGITVQPMFSSPNGLELIVGAKKDPVFGAVMMVGAGGITAEVLKDRALELPPLNERLALRMLQSLRIRPLLEGFRGRRAVDMNRLIEVLMRLSYLIADNPGIAELDVNPLLVSPEGATALDARIILDAKSVWKSLRPFAHLAIRPYPEEYVRHAQLHDGTDVLLRPIQPEDEPMWHRLLSECSERSLWLRFRYLFKETTHEMATRFCFIDYDRTMAIVAEAVQGLDRRLIGVGRLVADADHRKAEYAVLVADAWQGKGLGTLLTDFCLEICETWGIEFVYAETSAENHRMQQILFKRAFDRHSSSLHDFLFERHLNHGGSEGQNPHNSRGESRLAV